MINCSDFSNPCMSRAYWTPADRLVPRCNWRTQSSCLLLTEQRLQPAGCLPDRVQQVQQQVQPLVAFRVAIWKGVTIALNGFLHIHEQVPVLLEAPVAVAPATLAHPDDPVQLVRCELQLFFYAFQISRCVDEQQSILRTSKCFFQPLRQWRVRCLRNGQI